MKRASLIKKDLLDHDIQDLNHLSMLIESLQGGKQEIQANNAKKFHKVGERKYMDILYKNVKTFLSSNIDKHIYFICKELDSTGNFKLEEGSSNDKWYQSCINLVKSRFYPDDLIDLSNPFLFKKQI